jgi:hypothetical protein
VQEALMIERRVELRKKIEKRRELVIKALEHSVAQGAPAERCNGLSAELQVVDNALSGGWDTMAQATVAELLRWLDRTTPLVGGDIG